ncbi:MAG: ergothioneine biosynthesis protein EgtB [Betaproteobacteria bacterium]|nr:MAG: ergothioneine biosynthesis protein EgtB [Betaproteobacteria bacterium]
MARTRSARPQTSRDLAEDLAAIYSATRRRSEALAKPLSAEDCTVQSMPDASPVKWHLAHTTWFFETFVLERHARGFRPFDPAFRVLFNSYYNAVGEKHPRPERGMLTRPSLAEVLAYREDVDRRIDDLLGARGGVPAAVADLVVLGVNHEEQHQELILTDLKHLLSRNPLAPAYAAHWPLTPVRLRKMRWIRVAGGVREIGHDGAGFAFDNEGPRHRVLIDDFELASHPVTYGDYLGFIEDGGYRRPELWLSMGWDTVRAQGWEAPLYWHARDGRWFNFTLHGMVEIEPSTPVCHLSYYEADAYARWAGARLPTEFEWEAASASVPIDGNLVDSGALHPLAPRIDPSASGFAQLFGDVWEWTQSAYAPYPGYRPAPGAVGEYNGKFMCNQYVLRGGSCATPRRHIRATYRNFFPADARWQFSGVRLARDCR